MSSDLRVGVVGTGYVGLVTGACLAYIGHRVSCMDRDESRIRQLQSGVMPIYEPGLEELVAQLTGGQGTDEEPRLSFESVEVLERAVAEVDMLFIAVGTPAREDGSADLSNVTQVAREIGRALALAERETPLMVINKSTVPVGGGDYVSMLIQEGVSGVSGGGGAEYRIVSNPEFLREGSAVYDTLFPERVVLGVGFEQTLEAMKELYRPILEQSFPVELDPRPRETVPLVTMDLASAEMVKYAANAFLATKISFINEISNICELVGADVTKVASSMGLDERIGHRFLNAGIGWGGSCFPKDVSALRTIAREYDYEATMMTATVEVNNFQRKRIISKLQRHLRTLEGKRVALLGLSFKPNTDDLRDAPSLEIARMLNAQGARVVGYDPASGNAAAQLMPELQVAFDPYDATEGVHAAILVTEWEELRMLDLARVSSLMREPRLLIDGRNALEPAAAREAGLVYEGFGRV